MVLPFLISMVYFVNKFVPPTATPRAILGRAKRQHFSAIDQFYFVHGQYLHPSVLYSAGKKSQKEEDLDTKTNIKIRGYHIDHFGHVNHGRYIEFLEEARWVYMDANGLIPLFHETGIIHVVAHLSVSYTHSARANESIEIKTRLDKVGQASFTMAQSIFTKKKQVLEAQVTNVFIDIRTGKPAEPPRSFISGWSDLSDCIKIKGGKNG